MMALSQIKDLVNQEFEIVETNLDDFVNTSHTTYYLDKIIGGGFLISQDELPLYIFDNESDAREKYESLKIK